AIMDREFPDYSPYPWGRRQHVFGLVRHILFLDGNRYSTDFSCFDEPFDNAVYAAHDYAGPGVSSATAYPGTFRDEYFDRDVLERAFLRRTEFMRRTGTPIWVGEFGPMYPPEKPHEEFRYQVLQDQLDIYDDYGASWALWTYKDVGLQGVVYADPRSEYLRLIEGVRDLKSQLGTDSWGGSDLGVRDILDPIDAIMDREFPDYSPYPWGRRQHVFGLVRHILLAEPLAEKFGRLFTGVTTERARHLADAFRLENTLTRDRLVGILRERGGVTTDDASPANKITRRQPQE
ncbi:MAG TPA: cellulase family glycosylhydrolase, partial [Trueperaceae bacterium]|nr:cellulase family glycosylhydrolase [Trueperaceae bacterium]